METHVLTGLDLDDVERYLASTLGLVAAAELKVRVHARTAGNPLFLREATRVLDGISKKQGSVHVADVQLPDAAKVFFSQRFSVFERETREFLDAASVLGNDFELSLLQRVSKLSGEQGLLALEKAVNGGVLAPKPDVSHYGFVHPLLREVLYGEIPVSVRIRLHARCGLSIEQQGLTAHKLQELAYHFHHASADGHHERALRYAQAAGHDAMRTYAYGEAARYFDWALEALSQHANADLRAKCELMLRSASALLSAGDRRESRRRVKRAIELAEQGRHADLMLQGARLLRPTLSIAAVPDETAMHTLERALSLLPESDVALRAQAYCQLASVPPYSTSIERSRTTSDEAVRLARLAGDPLIIVDALGARLRALSGPDSIESQLEAASEILRLDPRRASRRSADAQIARYHALLRRGQMAAADRALEALGAIGRKLRVGEWIWHHDRFVAQRQLQAGQLTEAKEEFDRLWKDSLRLRLPYGAIYYGAQLSALQVERTGLRYCEVRENAGWAWARDIPVWRSERVLLMIEVGDEAQARSEFRALAKDGFAAVTRDSGCLFGFAKLTLAAIALDERDAARALYAILLPYSHLIAIGDLSFSAGSVSHSLGLLARYLGNMAEARTWLERATAVAKQVGDELQGQRSRLALAEVLSNEHSARNRTKAVHYASEVLAAAERTGRSALQASAQALLQRL